MVRSTRSDPEILLFEEGKGVRKGTVLVGKGNHESYQLGRVLLEKLYLEFLSTLIELVPSQSVLLEEAVESRQ